MLNSLGRHSTCLTVGTVRCAQCGTVVSRKGKYDALCEVSGYSLLAHASDASHRTSARRNTSKPVVTV